MVIRVDVVDAALQAVYGPDTEAMLADAAGGGADARRAGRSTTRWPRSSPASSALTLLCGRYEGIDERVARAPRQRRDLDRARTCCRAASWPRWWSRTRCCASCPARSATSDSAVEESFSAALEGGPEYPHYTRPASYRGWEVPEVLLSGPPRARCAEWRLRAAAGPARRPGRRGLVPLTSPRLRDRSRRSPPARRTAALLTDERADPKRRAPSAAPASRLPGRRPGARPLPGGRGHPAPHPGLRGRRPEAAGRRRPQRTFTVRKLSFGVGVERTFPVHSPKIERIEVDRARRGPPGEALLPARPDRPPGARAREPRLPPRGRGDDGRSTPRTARRRPRRPRPRQPSEAAARHGAVEDAAEPRPRPRPRRRAAAEEPEAEAEPAGRGGARGRGRAGARGERRDRPG